MKFGIKYTELFCPSSALAL